MNDPVLAEALRDLMEDLEAIGQSHEELYDTDVREQMSDAVYRSFLKPQPGYVLPDSFGTFDTESNRAIKAALARYIERATVRAAAIGLTDPQGRLDAFQDDAAKTRGEGQYFDDFFGWAESI